MATHTSVLAWESPWTKEAGGPQSMESWPQLSTHTHTHTHIHIFSIFVSFWKIQIISYYRLLWWLSDKASACQCRRGRSHPWIGKIPCRRKWQPTPVFLRGKSHGQRSLAGYTVHGVAKKLDTTYQLNNKHNPYLFDVLLLHLVLNFIRHFPAWDSSAGVEREPG